MRSLRRWTLFAKNRCVHAGYHPPRVRLTQVGIPLYHGQGLVAQYFGNLGEAGSRHSEVRGCGVAQIVEAKVCNARTLDGSLKGFTDAKRFASGGVWEDQQCV